MSTALVFRRIARIEFDEAADWYERRQAGLGPRFVAAVQRVLDRIAEQPDFYPVVHGEVREAFVQRFPFCIYIPRRSRSNSGDRCVPYVSWSVGLARPNVIRFLGSSDQRN